MGRWLKNRDLPSVQAVQNLLSHPKAIASDIRQFWIDFWQDHQTLNPETIAENLRRMAHVPAVEVDWGPPSLDVLAQAFRKSSGSGGGDCFKGCEIKHLPIAAISIFCQLALSWEEQGRAPAPFAHSRMVSLGKPSKISPEGFSLSLLADQSQSLVLSGGLGEQLGYRVIAFKLGLERYPTPLSREKWRSPIDCG